MEIMDIMDIREIMEVMDIMNIMDIMDIIDIMDIMIITAWLAMAGAVSALVVLPAWIQYNIGLQLLWSDMQSYCSCFTRPGGSAVRAV